MSSSTTLLKDKKVLVIGGTSGIGRAVAAATLSHGASVVIASSKQSKVDAAVKLLSGDIKPGSGVAVSGHSFDIKDFAALTGFLTKEAPFDHLIVTAGEAPPPFPNGLPVGVDVREHFSSSMDSRYWAVLNAANHVHQHKLIRPRGSIILTIGIAQKRPYPGWGFFLGATGAVETATRALALDLKPIRVNVISPGLVDTEFFDDMDPETKTSLFDTLGEKLLVGHVGTAEEIAEAYIFAMKCSYLTGQNILVDGGAVLV